MVVLSSAFGLYCSASQVEMRLSRRYHVYLKKIFVIKILKSSHVLEYLTLMVHLRAGYP